MCSGLSTDSSLCLGTYSASVSLDWLFLSQYSSVPLHHWFPQLLLCFPDTPPSPVMLPEKSAKFCPKYVLWGLKSGLCFKFACYGTMYGLELKEKEMFFTSLHGGDEIWCELHEGYGFYPLQCQLVVFLQGLQTLWKTLCHLTVSHFSNILALKPLCLLSA